MIAFVRGGAARVARGLQSSFAVTGARLAAIHAWARDWGWAGVVGRVLIAALGLVLLGAIGRSALARNVLSPEPVAGVDAGPAEARLASAAASSLTVAPTPVAAAPPPSAAPPEAALTTVDTSVAPPTTPVASARGRATPDDPVYLNEATLNDLHRLPGVGPKRAEAILALRAKLGHFRQIEDLLKVKGIGRASLRKLRPLVRLDPPPTRASDGGAGDARA